MLSSSAAIAANRFGLGARPQDGAAIGNDPRGWLDAQLTAAAKAPGAPKPKRLAAMAAEELSIGSPCPSERSVPCRGLQAERATARLCRECGQNGPKQTATARRRPLHSASSKRRREAP